MAYDYDRNERSSSFDRDRDRDRGFRGGRERYSSEYSTASRYGDMDRPYRSDRDFDSTFERSRRDRDFSRSGSSSYYPDSDYIGRDSGPGHDLSGRDRDWRSERDYGMNRAYSHENDMDRDSGFRRDWRSERDYGMNRAYSGDRGHATEASNYGRGRTSSYSTGSSGGSFGRDYGMGRDSGMGRDYGMGQGQGIGEGSLGMDHDYALNRDYSSARDGRERFDRGMSGNWGNMGAGAGYGRNSGMGSHDYVWGQGEGRGFNQGLSGPESTGFQGKGPKGWARSDERIKEEVCEALERDPRVDASEIEVEVKGQTVTLKGTVEDRRTKRRAEECVEACSGVKDVRNELTVSSRSSTANLSLAGNSQSAAGTAGKTASKH